ncbi:MULTISPECIES: DUF4190 domain-containing protein [unclassified Streptomyces]|uniref:DUF4190 domain-containing protein n=1 Tax=unclassified Streptomyces TaxID=2593676 RepID=UPI002E290E03|nr:DUF4190 domain-containing protein [Streptomyces sp. NBC_01429]
MASAHGQNYGYPGADPYGGPAPRNGLGIAALVVGLIGLVFFWTVVGGIVLGLLAIVFGIIGFLRGRRGEATNGTMSLIGAIIGALALVASGLLIAVGVSFLKSEEFGNLRDCLQSADTQAQQQKCQDDFKDTVN